MADPGFSRGGCANLLFDKLFQNFSQKMHGNEEILSERRVARPWSPPLDPPLESIFI